MYTLTLSGKFSAAHRLMKHSGKCVNLHGHTWKYEIELLTDEHQVGRDGILVDFGYLKRIGEKLDHATLLNRADPLLTVLEQYPFRLVVLDGDPTAENLAKWMWDRVNEIHKIFIQVDVTIWEADNAKVTCST